MGTVYRAEHTVIGKSVALKVLRDFGSNSIFVRRFEREAFATGRVEHPNCVTAFDGGELDDGRLFLAMELVDGVGLSRVLAADRCLPIERALHICSHVLRGLAFAHQAGVVHRDIKPENILLVEADGDPDFAKILDFGIAKLLDDAELAVDEQKATQIGTTIGTPTYMSPEQAFGQRVDGRADLYSTAVMLFEMVAGVPPYAATDNGTLLSMHVRDPIPKISDRNPDIAVPDGLDELLADALAKERKDRIASAEVFLARLEEIARAPIASEPSPVPDLTKPDSITSAVTPVAAVSLPVSAVRRRWTGPRIAVVVAGALAVLALLAVLGGEGGEAPPAGVVPPAAANYVEPVSTVASEARGMYDDGHYRAVVEYLEAKRSVVDADPAALLLLGHAYGKTKRLKKALETYNAAAELDLSVGDHGEVAATCREALGRKKTRKAAKKLVEKLLTTPRSRAIREMLREVASGEESMPLRRWARQTTGEHGVTGVDMLGSLALDLDQERSCKARKEVVAEIVELGDSKAIPILEAAKRRVRRTGFLRRRKNTNACLADTIDQAIATLR